MRIECDPDLVWYYQQASSDLGLRATSYSDTFDPEPKQRWPTEKQTRAATRQTAVRAALRQLSPRLQSVLECAYETRVIPVSTVAEHDLCAPLIERAARATRDKKVLENMVALAPVLLDAAHRAFRMVYGPPRPRGRRARVNQNVYRWTEEYVDAPAA